MTSRPNPTTSRPHASRKDSAMHHIDLRLAEIQERHELLRSHHEADRVARSPARSLARSIRSRLGELLIRLGRRVAGESATVPAWTG